MANSIAKFKVNKDSGQVLDITKEWAVSDLIRYTVPAGGPFITGAPQSNTLVEGTDVLMSPLATIPADTLSDPMTAANVLLFKEVSEAGGVPAATGPAVERTVIQANRGSVMSFGDFQFRVPSSGNSSLQYRVPSGVIAISDFVTKWSNQQGGASENAFGYNLSTSWAYFRLNGALNLTLHNSYQDAMFSANGWTYRVEVIVGSGWTNNRFSFTRWRQEGVKGDPGTDGNDGVDGKSIITSHRSDGVTAIGGTVYTLDHVIYEYSDSTFQDMGLLIAPVSSPDVLLGSYDSTSFVSTRTFTLPDGRTWQDVLDQFKFVYFLVGGNNLFTHEQTRMFHVDDLVTPNRDLSLTSYQDHGTNSYHMKFRIPFGTATTITVDNDGSTMQVQRIIVRGIK